MRTFFIAVFLLATGPFATAEQTVRQIEAFATDTTPGMANAAVYVSLINSGAAPATLTGVSLTGNSEGLAKAAQIHTRIIDGDLMRMIEIPKPLVIFPNETLVMAPGGYHIMLFGLKNPLEAGTFLEVTLHLTGDEITDLTVGIPILSIEEISSSLADETQ